MTGLANYGNGNLVYGSRDGWWTNINLGGTTIWQGIDVDKVGRTTGWSRGQLSATCIHITINPGLRTEYRVLCANQVQGAYAGEGDSGSPVFVGHDDSNSQLNALGILFGGDFSGGFDIDDDGNAFCNSAQCVYSYNRLSRVEMFLTVPY